MDKLEIFNFFLLLESLEEYIEKTGLFPNFKRQFRNITIPKEKKYSVSNCENLFRTKLLIFLGVLSDDTPDDTRKEVKEEFWKWIDSVGIDANNCPDKNLKHFLLEIEDILEKQSDKIYNEMKAYLWRKRKESPDPKKAVEVFKNVSNVMVNMPSFDHFDTKGNTEEGKKILAEIANSFSSEERENFHFYPSFTSEEKAEYEKEQKEGKKSDPITKGQRINAIEEIKNALQKELKLANHDLDPENQDWENEINRTEKIMEIEKVKRRVLADIEKKRHQKKTNQTSISNENDNKFPVNWIIGGVVIIVIAFLGGLILYEKKK